MTAGGPNEYGDDSPKNRFTDPATGEAYFLIIDKKTGKTKIYNEEWGSDKYIGEYDPKTGKIKYNRNLWGGARKEEKDFFNNNPTLIKDQAKKIIVKEAPGTTSEKVAEASKLMNENIPVENLETLDSADGTGVNPVKSQLNNGTDAFVYPENLRFEKQDTITFTQLVYHTTGFDSTKIRAFQERKETSQIKERRASIILPIPGAISSQNNTDWNGEKMNAIQAAGANAILTAGQEGATAAVQGLQNKVEALSEGQTGANVKSALLAAIASNATGTGAQLLTRTTGMVLNPNMELLFRGPQLRTFGFEFILTPRSANEGKIILQIIRLFKQGMAPQRSQDHLFLKTPNTFELKYAHEGNSHHALNKFKECALTSCNVEYTPNANYSTFKDGIMTQYKMTLGFSELVPIYNDDYGSDKKIPAEIGF
jgi:hypothetical protein